ncbi:hypothetical protein DFH07DRAFT_954775 [Mycena maculata]|uniref:Uncharacterized protein n=1 Tax=Mycena maculata TaxID=230809 RepID=A0AAD7JM84_9AGAR|nr:hypothetical protein DFH07DRAFT_954775 [Mycena maculata]
MFDFVHSLSESERQRLLRLIRKILDPIERAEATYNLRPYKPEVPGVVYTNYRANHKILDGVATTLTDEEVDWVDLKAGRTNDIDRRRGEYTRDCKGEEIAWVYYYPTNRPKLLEALVHLSVRARLANREPYPCYGCGKRHCEHSSWERIGGLEGMADIIEYWQGRLGEPIIAQKSTFKGTAGSSAADDERDLWRAGKHKEAREGILNIESSTFQGTATSTPADDERGLWRAGNHKEARDRILNIESSTFKGTATSTPADDECGLWRAGKHKEARAGILSIESVSGLKGTARSIAADDERGVWRAGKHQEAREGILNIEWGTARSSAADEERGLWRAGKHKEAREDILNIESLESRLLRVPPEVQRRGKGGKGKGAGGRGGKAGKAAGSKTNEPVEVKDTTAAGVSKKRKRAPNAKDESEDQSGEPLKKKKKKRGEVPPNEAASVERPRCAPKPRTAPDATPPRAAPAAAGGVKRKYRGFAIIDAEGRDTGVYLDQETSTLSCACCAYTDCPSWPPKSLAPAMPNDSGPLLEYRLSAFSGFYIRWDALPHLLKSLAPAMPNEAGAAVRVPVIPLCGILSQAPLQHLLKSLAPATPNELGAAA